MAGKQESEEEWPVVGLDSGQSGEKSAGEEAGAGGQDGGGQDSPAHGEAPSGKDEGEFLLAPEEQPPASPEVEAGPVRQRGPELPKAPGDGRAMSARPMGPPPGWQPEGDGGEAAPEPTPAAAEPAPQPEPAAPQAASPPSRMSSIPAARQPAHAPQQPLPQAQPPRQKVAVPLTTRQSLSSMASRRLTSSVGDPPQASAPAPTGMQQGHVHPQHMAHHPQAPQQPTPPYGQPGQPAPGYHPSGQFPHPQGQFPHPQQHAQQYAQPLPGHHSAGHFGPPVGQHPSMAAPLHAAPARAAKSARPMLLTAASVGLIAGILLVRVTPVAGIIGLESKKAADRHLRDALVIERDDAEQMLKEFFPEKNIDYKLDLKEYREEQGVMAPEDLDPVQVSDEADLIRRARSRTQPEA